MSLLSNAYEDVVLMENAVSLMVLAVLLQIGLKALFFRRRLHLTHQWKVVLPKSKVFQADIPLLQVNQQN